jgi:hypothetical protein
MATERIIRYNATSLNCIGDAPIFKVLQKQFIADHRRVFEKERERYVA